MWWISLLNSLHMLEAQQTIPELSSYLGPCSFILTCKSSFIPLLLKIWTGMAAKSRSWIFSSFMYVNSMEVSSFIPASRVVYIRMLYLLSTDFVHYCSPYVFQNTSYKCLERDVWATTLSCISRFLARNHVWFPFSAILYCFFQMFLKRDVILRAQK